MMRDASKLLLLAAGLSAVAGCSRTYDGTVVPTYSMAVENYAGVPLLTMRRTSLDEPSAAMAKQEALAAFPPPPPAPLQPASPAAAPAPIAATPSARRTVPRRVAPLVPPTAGKPLACRNQPPGERAVSIVCE